MYLINYSFTYLVTVIWFLEGFHARPFEGLSEAHRSIVS